MVTDAYNHRMQKASVSVGWMKKKRR